MKLLNIFLSILLIGLVAAKQQQTNSNKNRNTAINQTPAPTPKPKQENKSCFHNVRDVCHQKETDEDFEKHCNSTMKYFETKENDVQHYTYHLLTSSYDYILLSTVFSSYEKDRPGFAKIFRELSDKAFDNTIKLIKYITSRGGVFDFSKLSSIPHSTTTTVDLNELHALAWALDKEKELSHSVSDLHKKVIDSDPLTAHFLEEEFFEDQIKTIRKLSGHVNDLKKIMLSSKDDTALGVHLFDEYLQ